MKRELVVHGVYRHFKGNKYIVEDVAIDSETDEYLVLYRALLYARPMKMFLGAVDREKYPDVKQKWRFELIEERDKTK